MLSPPKMPDPPKPPAAPPPAPTQDDPQINKEAEDRRKRILMAQGRQSTILSGSMGDPDDPNVAQKSLLGS